MNICKVFFLKIVRRLINKEFYKRLLKIQICDAKGYEKEHSKEILKELNITQKILYK